MMISDEQARLAMRVLQDENGSRQSKTPCVMPVEFTERIRRVLDSMPDCREERIIEARNRLAAAPPSASEVADMMIARIISDSLR